MNTLLSLMAEERPRMDKPAAQKDEQYDAKMGRADASSVNSTMIVKMHEKAWLAEKAYRGEPMTQEDYDTFFTDDSMNTRNRTVFNFNMVKPIVEQARGTALRSSFNAKVKPVTHRTETRRMQAMGQQLLMHSLGDMSKEMRAIIGSHYNLGDTMGETRNIFESKWKDPNIKAIQHLLQRMLDINELDRYASEDAMNFVLWGVSAKIARGRGSHYRWDHVHPSQFFWDTMSKRFDQEDAAFKGIFQDMTMPRIAEDWNVDKDTLQDIEQSLHAYGPRGKNFSLMSLTQVRTTTNFWTDVMYQEFGYINMGDVPTLVRVGDREDGYKDNPITYNDLIDPPDTPRNEELFKGKKTRKSYVECPRFVEMVLWEDLAGTSVKKEHQRAYESGNLPDLVLDSGPWPLQEYNPYDPAYARNPVKSVMFAQAGGEVVSPIQAVLSPNRFMDRLASAIEQQANDSGGRATVIDMDQIDPKQDANDVRRELKNGGMIEARTNGRGVNGVITSQDNSMGSGVYSMLQIMSATEEMVRKVMGNNSTFSGETAKDQRNGVAAAMIQRGDLMMSPIHNCLDDQKLQMCRSMVTAGKEWYLQHPDVLVDLVTEADLLYLYQGRDFEMERFDVTLKPDDADETKMKEAKFELDRLVQLGFIDRARYADLYDRADMDEIAPAIRQYTAELMQAEAAQQKAQAKQQMLAGLAQKDQELAAKEDSAHQDQVVNAQALAKEGAKAQAGVARDNNKAAIDAQQAEQAANAPAVGV